MKPSTYIICLLLAGILGMAFICSFQNSRPVYTVLTNNGSHGKYICWSVDEGKQLEFEDLVNALNTMSQHGYVVVTNVHAQGYDQTILVRK